MMPPTQLLCGEHCWQLFFLCNISTDRIMTGVMDDTTAALQCLWSSQPLAMRGSRLCHRLYNKRAFTGCKIHQTAEHLQHLLGSEKANEAKIAQFDINMYKENKNQKTISQIFSSRRRGTIHQSSTSYPVAVAAV